MLMNKKSTNFAICFGLSSAWFGTHCGSGFATGAQSAQFWTAYGAYAIFLPIISVVIMAAVAFVQWEFCRLYKTYDYRAYSNELFKPYDKIFATIYEIFIYCDYGHGSQCRICRRGPVDSRFSWNSLCALRFDCNGSGSSSDYVWL